MPVEIIKKKLCMLEGFWSCLLELSIFQIMIMNATLFQSLFISLIVSLSEVPQKTFGLKE